MLIAVIDPESGATMYVEGEAGSAFVKVTNPVEDPVLVSIVAGGPLVANVMLQDNAGVLFIVRDDGITITHVRLDTGATFTPTAPIIVAGVTGVNAADFGVKADAEASTDTGAFSLIALFKRLLAGIASLIGTAGVDRVIASDGVLLPVSSLAQTVTFAGPGGVKNSTSVTYLGNTYIQTLTFTGANVTGISTWVKQ